MNANITTTHKSQAVIVDNCSSKLVRWLLACLLTSAGYLVTPQDFRYQELTLAHGRFMPAMSIKNAKKTRVFRSASTPKNEGLILKVLLGAKYLTLKQMMCQ